MVQALENLQNALSYETNVKDRGNEIAYALYVLARNRKAAISDLRYYADAMLGDFPTPLAKAHIAAALALYGDARRSQDIFAAAANMSTGLVNVSLARSDYGSSLRDGAAVLALAAESRPVPPIIPELSRVVAREWQQARYTSTQEQTWMLLAARAIQGGDEDMRIEVNGAARTGSYAAHMTGDALIEHSVVIRNEGTDAVSAVVTTVAAPAQPLSAGGEGFAIERSYYTLDGTAANVSEARQNERYVVVLKVTETNDWPSRVLITDLLPAVSRSTIQVSSTAPSSRISNGSAKSRLPIQNSAATASWPPSTVHGRQPRDHARLCRARGDARHLRPSGRERRGHVPAAILGAHGDGPHGGAGSPVGRRMMFSRRKSYRNGIVPAPRLPSGRGRAIVALSLALILSALAVFTLEWADRTFPPPLSEADTVSAEVLDRDGHLLRAFAAKDGLWRLKTTAQDVDPRFIEMLIAYEDQRFRELTGSTRWRSLAPRCNSSPTAVSSPAHRRFPCRWRGLSSRASGGRWGRSSCRWRALSRSNGASARTRFSISI